jgi:DNA-binding MarR family transcriptional regulator
MVSSDSDPVADYPLALLVVILTRVVDDAVEEKLIKAGFDDLTRSLGVVFEMLDDAGSRVSDMARRARMTKQGMGQLVAAVEALGYVTRAPDPADKRAQLVKLTRRGHRASAAGRVGLEELEAKWHEVLGPAQYERVTRALRDAVRATGLDHVR